MFTESLPKIVKGFAKMGQMKDTSTVLEPSISFHTFVKLVEAEDIANDKNRIHDLTLGIYSITNQLQSQKIDFQQSEQLMFTQPGDPKNKEKHAFQNFCPLVVEHITTSQQLSKNSAKVNSNETQLDGLNLLKNHFYNTFILLLVIILF